MDYLNYHLSLPQNYLAEEILLGYILINPNIFNEIINNIQAEYFFLECNQIIYKNLIKIYKENKVDPMQLLYSLSSTKTLSKVGGLEKIIELMKQSQIFTSSIITNIYLQKLIESIHSNYIKRLMIQYGYNIIQLAYINKFPSYKLYNRANYYLNDTAQKIPKQNIDNLQDLIINLITDLKYNNKKIKNNYKKEEVLMPYGFKDLDNLTNGLNKGDLIIIAGRPSMGKTSFAINIAYKIVDKLNKGISIFSLEMSKIQILYKLISIASSISIKNIKEKNINQNQFSLIQKICNKLLNSKIYINDNPSISIDYIEYTTQIIQQEKACIELIIIDYLQLIQMQSLLKNNRSQELSYITRKLKLLAQALNIPIIVLSQLNRSIETRINKEPLLSDLRESGCLNYSNNIKIDTINNLNIKNLLKSYTKKQINYYPNIKNLNIKTTYLTSHILLQYIYLFTVDIFHNIKITHNHKLFKQKFWIKQNHIIDNIMILKNLNISEKHLMLENLYIKNIKYIRYSTVFDIRRPRLLNLISNHIVLHNSIEQDADIVMILYQKNQENTHENKLSNLKIIDFYLCKNRNGPSGFFKLLFSNQNTVFKNI
uniref:DNA 5'-3' helicase n=1 Tax=Plocamium cartilagineum TaxID=31452 RepID=A0A1C9CHY4_PLOCA|nr:replication helicase subunit [Plocamium cartilagineum]AOM67991.1 replication helicase subunit [Plocamium cartilagineum]